MDNYFPLGLLYLGSMLNKYDIETAIVDINNHFYKMDFSDELLKNYLETDLIKHIKFYKPDIIGIGCTFSGAFRSLKIIAERIKMDFPGVPIVVGGIHPTVFSREILGKYDYIDYVVIGEGETTFLQLVRSIAGQEKPLSAIDGITFRKNGSVTMNPKTKYQEDLDELPFIDYTLLNRNEYQMDTSGWYSPKKIKIGQPYTIVSSRSCPYHCTFCSTWWVQGRKIRFRSAENVLEEMQQLYDRYNVRYFQFMDDNITFDKKGILAICDGIKKRKMNIQFDTPNGLAINTLDEEVISALVGAGLTYTCLGIESGSEYIRNKAIKKGLTTEKIYKTVELCAKYDHLFIKGFFMIGMPQETRETLNETFEMVQKLPLDKFSMNFAAPYVGTELFNYCQERSLLQHKPEDYIDIEIYQDSDAQPHFKPHELTIEELIEFRKKCFDYLKEKRQNASVPENYPFRYRG